MLSYVLCYLAAEPGAPLGSRLTEQVQLEYDKVTYNTAFMRHFIFTPKIGQEGTSYDVCFQGIDGNKMSSRKKCFHINGESDSRIPFLPAYLPVSSLSLPRLQSLDNVLSLIFGLTCSGVLPSWCSPGGANLVGTDIAMPASGEVVSRCRGLPS